MLGPLGSVKVKTAAGCTVHTFLDLQTDRLILEWV